MHSFSLSSVALWWTAKVLLRFGTPNLPEKVLFSELAWFGIVGAPMFWAAGILSYSGFRRLGTRKPFWPLPAMRLWRFCRPQQ